MDTLRRKHTGEPGNGGLFTGHDHSEATLTLDAVPAELNSPSYLGINEIPAPPGVILPTEDLAGGYDQIDRYEDGTTVFRRNGLPHRQNGPAIFRPTLREVYCLYGEEVTPPDIAGGTEIGLRLDHVDRSGTQYWRTEDQYEALVNGTQSFFLDGDLHRDGGPAIIAADGTEHWMRYGREFPSPLPGEPTVKTEMVGTEKFVTTVGAKYNPALSAQEIGKRLRSDLNYAKAVGILPPSTYVEVTATNRTNRAIVHIRGVHRDEIWRDGQYTIDGKRIQDQLTRIIDAHVTSTVCESTGVVERSLTTSIDYWIE